MRARDRGKEMSTRDSRLLFLSPLSRVAFAFPQFVRWVHERCMPFSLALMTQAMMASIFGQLAVTDQCTLHTERVKFTRSLTSLLTSEKQSESIRYTVNASNVIDESVERFLCAHCLPSKYWLMDTSSSIFYSRNLSPVQLVPHTHCPPARGESTEMSAHFNIHSHKKREKEGERQSVLWKMDFDFLQVKLLYVSGKRAQKVGSHTWKHTWCTLYTGQVKLTRHNFVHWAVCAVHFGEKMRSPFTLYLSH